MIECERSLKARVVGIATLVGGGGRERGGMDECQRRERERERRWEGGYTLRFVCLMKMAVSKAFFLCFGRLGMGVFFDVVGWVSGDGGFLA